MLFRLTDLPSISEIFAKRDSSSTNKEYLVIFAHAAAILGKWKDFDEMTKQLQKFEPDFANLSRDPGYTNGRPFPFPDFKALISSLENNKVNEGNERLVLEDQMLDVFETKFKLINVSGEDEKQVVDLKKSLLENYGTWKIDTSSPVSSLFVKGYLLVGLNLAPHNDSVHFCGFRSPKNTWKLARVLDNDLHEYILEIEDCDGSDVLLKGEFILRSFGKSSTISRFEVQMKAIRN